MNPKVKIYLDRLASSAKRPSSYLFTGVNEEEIEEAAFYFISKLAGKFGDSKFLERVKAKNHPDVVIIEPEIEEKKGRSREKEISIFQAREALERLKFFPYELKKKFCIVKKSHKMNSESSNALLKNLEEPKKSAIFILLASDAEAVLPTIVSRCAVLRFPQTELPQWKEENRERFRRIFKEDIFEKFDYMEKISKDKNEMTAVLRDWELVEAEGLRKLVMGDADQRKIEKVIELIENTRESINQLEYTNASARAVGEKLILGN